MRERLAVCDCPVFWVSDSTVATTHCMVPVQCKDYMKALETKLIELSSTDRNLLVEVQKSLIRTREGTA